MTHEISSQRMSALSSCFGTIGIEDVGKCESVEMVVRIPMDRETASEMYYQLGNMGEDPTDLEADHAACFPELTREMRFAQ